MDKLAVYKKIFWRFYLGFRIREKGFLFSISYLPKKREPEFLENSLELSPKIFLTHIEH